MSISQLTFPSPFFKWPSLETSKIILTTYIIPFPQTTKDRFPFEMALHLDDISTICASKESWKIVVKVVRLWTSQSVTNSKLPFSMEMVLMDAKGSKIQASIRKTLIYKFDRLLSEGHVYCLSYFGVGDNGGSYRYTRHAFKLNFQFNTKVQEIRDSPINILPYSFVSLSDIMFNEHNTDFLVDVIGVLTGVGSEREYEKNQKKQKILCIELDADGNKLIWIRISLTKAFYYIAFNKHNEQTRCSLGKNLEAFK